MALRSRKAAERLSEALEMTSALAMDELWSRMLGEGLGLYSTLQRQGAAPEEIAAEVEAFLVGLSTKPEESLAREASAVAYSEGRSAALLVSRDTGAATFAIRSEILDNDTCEVCARLDGTVVEIGSDEFDELKPPARCLGGDRCRGVYIALTPGLIERGA